MQHLADVCVQQDGLPLERSHGKDLAQIDAGVGGIGILRRHAQERHLDDAGSIATDPQLQKQDALPGVVPQEPFIAAGGGVPALIHQGASGRDSGCPRPAAAG